MPQESTYQKTLDTDAVNKSIDIAWTKEYEHVQIGTRFHGTEFHFTLEAPVDTKGPYDSLHVTLTTRKQVNDVIRVLRKARDQAFGADA